MVPRWNTVNGRHGWFEWEMAEKKGEGIVGKESHAGRGRSSDGRDDFGLCVSDENCPFLEVSNRK